MGLGEIFLDNITKTLDPVNLAVMASILFGMVIYKKKGK